MRTRLALPLPVTLILLSLAAPTAGAPFGFEELVRLERIEAAEVSPDGTRLCLQRAAPDLEKNALGSTLWLVEFPGGAARPLTFARRPDARDRACRFSPDGKRVAFISSREGASQLYLLDLGGGEARRLTDLPGGADGPLWTPDGRAIVVRAPVYPDCPPYPEGDACNRKRAAEREAAPVKARVIERLFYRHWDSWFDGQRSHLLKVAVEPRAAAPVDLTPGDIDAPALARAGAQPYAISPDGQELAVVENPDRELSTSTNTDIVLRQLGGDPRRARPRGLTAENRASDSVPRYSPDGRYLAYAAQRRPGFEADRWVLWLYDRKTQKRSALTEALDAHAGDAVWSPDSKRVYFITSLKARPRIYVVDVPGGAPEEIAVGAAHDLAVRGNALYFRGSSLSRPDEVYRLPLDGRGRAGGPAARLTTVTAGLDRLGLGAVTELWAKTEEGLPLHSWLVLPAGFQPGRRYPAAVLIHGGPQGAWEDDWHYRWNAQAYAGAGYVVLLPNPRGSEGFGQRFVDEVSGSWGGKPYDDVLRAVDQLAALPYVDRKRIGALGASYGGYLVSSIATHTDRFAALVSHDGVYDLRSMHGETEEIWFPRWEFGGNPWESDQYDKWSPSRFAAGLKTPMLVITNERDYRVPVGQGMQLFTALQLRRVPSKMVIFPDENHWVLKPGNARLWYGTVLDWLHRYLGGAKVDERVLRLAATHAR